jgi:hypothetical protein
MKLGSVEEYTIRQAARQATDLLSNARALASLQQRIGSSTMGATPTMYFKAEDGNYYLRWILGYAGFGQWKFGPNTRGR